MALIVMYNLYYPMSYVFFLIGFKIFRDQEHEADIFACQRGYQKDMIEALFTIFIKNKERFIMDPIYSIFYLHHPSLI